MPEVKQIEYTIEHGAVFIPIKGSKQYKKLLPGARITLPPRIAAVLLTNKARATTIVEAEREANAAAKAEREAVEADLRERTEAPIIDEDVADGSFVKESVARTGKR
jgi:hypothetical protein